MGSLTLPKLDCSGCRACCVGDKIRIMPERGDHHRRWKTDVQPDGSRTLKRDANGNCVYLGANGCTIHGKQPYMCRAYDCRLHYLGVKERFGEAGVAVRIATGMQSLAEGERRLLHGREHQQDQQPAPA